MRPAVALLCLWLPLAAPAGDTPPAGAAADSAATADDEDCAVSAPGWPAAVAEEQQALAALPSPPGSREARQMAQTVLDADEFGRRAAVPGWRWEWRFQREREEDEPADLPWLESFAGFLDGLARMFGTFGHVVLWLLLLVLLLVLWRQRATLARLWPRSRATTQRIAGIDIAPLLAPDALPDDVVAGSEHLWRAGHPREALSLLYRAALFRLGTRLAFPIPESGTETECLALVTRRADASTAAAFRTLVDAWMRMAWQHRPPADFAPLVDAYRRAAAGADATLQAATPRGAA
ncbi:MAG: hypothetical protein ACOY33_02960 [Pseudomonadota bacterium]